MPRIFLSPSTQEYNPYVTGGNEELYANLIADAMEPYLRASGIDFTRNDPNGSVSTSIAASNAGNYDFHLAIHSNAAPANLAGMLQGPDVYYYRDSSRSRAAAGDLRQQSQADLSEPGACDRRTDHDPRRAAPHSRTGCAGRGRLS